MRLKNLTEGPNAAASPHPHALVYSAADDGSTVEVSFGPLAELACVSPMLVVDCFGALVASRDPPGEHAG